jgi:hypothetical protein
MKGDFSRDTFDATKHFSRLMMQQGRVQLDADWNEQGSIAAHYLRSLAMDLIGPHGGPGDGFKISRIPAAAEQPLEDLGIAAGRYYVAGLLCEHRAEVGGRLTEATYWTQRDYPVGKDAGALPQAPFLVYLDVWERHITVVEDPSLLEPALGGADTCTRAQVVWQAKVMPLSAPTTRATGVRLIRLWRESAEKALRLTATCKPKTRARAYSGNSNEGSGTRSGGSAAYRGTENRLYRVEIHDGGAAPSFKWSRVNGSVVFPITELRDTEVQVGRASELGLKLRCGDWVEVVDDDTVLLWRTAPLLRAQAIDLSTGMVTLSGKPPVEVDSAASKHPLLRRWEGWQPVRRASVAESMDWQELEDGVEVQFGADGDYCTGDYWLIPARVATGDVIWPTVESNQDGPEPDHDRPPCPASLPPAGVEHHFAPLSVLIRQKSGNVIPLDLRRVFKRLVSD